MNLHENEIADILEKKRGQVSKAKTRLDSRARKNQRRQANRDRFAELIAKSERKIREYEALITYHREMIADWVEKLANVLPDDPDDELRGKFDEVNGQLERMEMLAIQIVDMQKKVDGEPEGPMKDAYQQVLKKYIKSFKSEKGHGF